MNTIERAEEYKHIDIIYSATFSEKQKKILLILAGYIPTIVCMVTIPFILKGFGIGNSTTLIKLIIWCIRIAMLVFTGVIVKLRLKVWISNDYSKRRNSINLIIQREIEAASIRETIKQTKTKEIYKTREGSLKSMTDSYIKNKISYHQLFDFIDKEY